MKRMKSIKQQPEQKKINSGKMERLIRKYGSLSGRYYDSERRGAAIANKNTGWYVNV
jgi:hypothetical protein